MRIQFQKYNFLFFFIITLFISEASVAQFDIPPKPSKQSEQTSLYDYIDLLNASQQSNLENKLILQQHQYLSILHSEVNS